MRFYLLGDGEDGGGALVLHEPGDEVGSVAAEVGEGAAAVEDGVGEPGEEVFRAADFARALVSVVDDDFTQFTDGLVLVGEAVSFVVGGIPGGLEVDDEMDAGVADG